VLIGQASALRLIDVRPYAWYQHFLSWERLASERPLATGVLLFQAIVVVVLSWRTRRQIEEALAGLVSLRSLSLILAFAGFSLVVPTESIARVFGELILAGTVAVVSLLTLILAALALPESDVAHARAWVEERITLRQGSQPMRRWDSGLPWAVALWVAAIAAAANYFVLEHLPHIDDSVSNLYHAKYFAAGHLYLPAPPDFESFRMDLTVVRDGKWFGYAFPGWPAVLALGVLVGVPWLVNPLLGGALILLAHAWVRHRYDRGTANLSVLILVASSWLIFTSAEMLGHPLTATLALLALVAFDRATEERGRWLGWSILAGASVGGVLLTRAFDGILVAGAIGLLSLLDGSLLRAWKAIFITAAVTAVVAALIFPYNQAVTGKATYPAHVAWADEHYGPGIDVLGFGPNVGIGTWPNLDPLPGHGPADVVLNWNKNFFMVNVDLFGWATGSLLFVWLVFALRRWHRADRIVLALPATYVIGYSAFYFSGGPDLGARYWYPILVPLAVLTARGIQMTSATLDREARPDAGVRIGVFVVIATLGAAAVMLPWRAMTKHYRYRGVTGEVRELAAAHGFEHALVFMRAAENGRDYQSAFVLNPRTLDDSGTVYAFDAGPENRAVVVSHYADRPVWVIGRVEDPTGNQPFRILAGPLKPGTVPP
jgi:hypothetical protein